MQIKCHFVQIQHLNLDEISMYAVLLRWCLLERNYHLEISNLDAWVYHDSIGSWCYYLSSLMPIELMITLLTLEV